MDYVTDKDIEELVSDLLSGKESCHYSQDEYMDAIFDEMEERRSEW